MKNSSIRIVHISDLHIGMDYYKENGDPNHVVLEFTNNILSKLCHKLLELNQVHAIDYIVFTGDIAFSGSEREYFGKGISPTLKKRYKIISARDFFGVLAENLSIKRKSDMPKIILCPGNHDLQHDPIDGYLKRRFSNASKKSEILMNKYLIELKNDFEKNYYNLEKKFENYIKFCKNPHPNVLITKLHLEDKIESYLNGYFYDGDKDFSIVILNTAWLSFPHRNDLGDLLTGGVFVRRIFNQLARIEPGFVLTAFHHPEFYLKWEERFGAPGLAQPIFPFICDKSDIILTGHEHANTHAPNLLYNKTLSFSSGASYEKPANGYDNYYNTFHCLDINRDENYIVRNSYEYKSHDGKDFWKQSNEDSIKYQFTLKLIVRKEEQLTTSKDYWDALEVKPLRGYPWIKKIESNKHQHYHFRIWTNDYLNKFNKYLESRAQLINDINATFHVYFPSDNYGIELTEQFDLKYSLLIRMNKIFVK